MLEQQLGAALVNCNKLPIIKFCLFCHLFQEHYRKMNAFEEHNELSTGIALLNAKQ